MIRSLLIAAGFLVVTIALLLLQPHIGPQRPSERRAAELTEPAVEQSVTRSQTTLLSVGEPESAVSEAASETASVVETLRPQAQPEPVVQTAEPVKSQTPPSDMESMTANVLASLRQSGAASTGERKLQSLIVQALQQGQNDAYINALVNEAAAGGSVDVPSALRTGTGAVDTNTLLASLVARSGDDAPQNVEIVDDKGVEIRMVQRANETVQYRFYTVQRGDSLGGIAAKFYGKASYYTIIFDANRQFLSSPDTIRAGQRLTVPIL